MNYYNENNRQAAAWLKYLMLDGLIPEGHIDTRSIAEVKPEEIHDYTQCHFFAGIAGWSLALQMAGVSPDFAIDTASCPCQPFSNAGKQLGYDDPRHLWPVLRELTKKRRPAILIGEQVASADGREWLAGVQFDLENMGYAFGAADLCAAGIAAPHIRQRLYWMGYAESERGCERNKTEGVEGEEFRRHCETSWAASIGGINGMANNNNKGLEGREREELSERENERTTRKDGDTSGLVLANGSGRETGRQWSPPAGYGRTAESAGGNGLGPWDRYDIIPFKNGKFRRVEPGTFPMASGIPGRVGLLRGYGNSIVPPLAAEFIRAALDSIAECSTSALTKWH